MLRPFIEGAKKLLADISRRRPVEPAPVNNSLSEHFREDRPSAEVRAQARINGELWGMTRVNQVAAVSFIIIAGMMLATSVVVSQRPIQQIQSKGDLREQIQSHFDSEGVRTDDLVLYLHSIFTLKFSVSQDGVPYIALLQGLVSNDIYETTSRTIERNMPTVRSQGITQSINIANIADVDFDEKNKRIGATIVGTLSTHITKTKKGGSLVMPPVPYRARVIVEIMPKSKVNPYGYFLLSPLEEYFGEADVKKFDNEMEQRRARLTGKQ